MNPQFKLNITNNKSMYKSIINILEKHKLIKNEIELAWIKAKEIDKTFKWSNFRSLKGRNQYRDRVEKEMAFDAIKQQQQNELEVSK